MSYQTFKERWNGKRVDFDHVYQFQCVDLIQQYGYDEYGVNGSYGNAIDYATNPDKRLLEKFEKLNTKELIIGDIVVLYGVNGSVWGHIGIFDGWQDATHFQMLEQNGATGNGQGLGNDRICVFRKISKSRIAGVLRPNGVTVAPPVGVDGRIGKVLYLDPIEKWSVYRVGDKPLGSNRIGYIKPALFESGLPAPRNRGLAYRIVGVSQYANTVTIRTQTYGLVDIWIGDNDSEIL